MHLLDRRRHTLGPWFRRSLVGLCLTSWLIAAGASEEVRRHDGIAYRRYSEDVVYRESHWHYTDVGQQRWLVLYRCADGQPFARKQLFGDIDTAAPDFAFVDERDGYREGLRRSAEAREVYWQPSATSPERSEVVNLGADAVVDAGFDAFVRTHWTELVEGRPHTATFLLPSDFNFLQLVLRKTSTAEPGPTTQFTLRAAAWYAFVLPEITLTYRNSDRRLMRFAGVSTIRDERGKRQSVDVVFPADLEALATSPAEVAAAQSAPLVAQCSR